MVPCLALSAQCGVRNCSVFATRTAEAVREIKRRFVFAKGAGFERLVGNVRQVEARSWLGRAGSACNARFRHACRACSSALCTNISRELTKIPCWTVVAGGGAFTVLVFTSRARGTVFAAVGGRVAHPVPTLGALCALSELTI